MLTPLSFSEAAAAIPCSISMLRRLHKKGVFKGVSYRVGSRIYFNPDKLQEWKENGGTENFEKDGEN